jgi:hypothetical protein
MVNKILISLPFFQNLSSSSGRHDPCCMQFEDFASKFACRTQFLYLQNNYSNIITHILLLLLVSTVLVVQNEQSLPKTTFLKVPKCDISDHPDFLKFYTMKSLKVWGGG